MHVNQRSAQLEDLVIHFIILPVPMRQNSPTKEQHFIGVESVGLAVGGKVLGHRSLLRYYKQSIRFGDQRDAVLINRVSGQYRLLGWTGHERLTARIKAAKKESIKRKKFDLNVGVSNYYTRKSRIKPKMAVFNSGYRP